MSSLDINRSRYDMLIAAFKGVLGAVPFAGSMLAEIYGVIVPNQQLDRVAKFAEQLQTQLQDLEASFIEKQLRSEYFVDMMEESVSQATRSLSDKRREYLSSIVNRGIRSENKEYSEMKHMLRILGEISDVEVVVLNGYLYRTMSEAGEYMGRYPEIYDLPELVFGASEGVLDKHAIMESYEAHLESLGLLERTYDVAANVPVVNKSTGVLKKKGYRLTLPGKYLLKIIGAKGPE